MGILKLEGFFWIGIFRIGPMDGLILKLLVFWMGSKKHFMSNSQFEHVTGKNFVKNQPWLQNCDVES